MSQLDPRLVAAQQSSAAALELHPQYRGKMQMLPKCPIRGFDDFAVWYTPGVAAPCRDIQAHPERVYEHTNRGNSIAIVSDGTRVLGLGDIGPSAGLPVMEGKALLMKYLGGIDAVPLCLGTKDPAQIVQAVRWLEPSFGGVNLEDISQPKCFGILDELRRTAEIPVWHDDQQGTATVVLAGLLNALTVVGKSLADVRITMLGVGAANVATYRLLVSQGVAPSAIVMCDRRGPLHRERADIEQRQDEFRDKWRICCDSNARGVRGEIADALRGADVLIAFSSSGPGVVRPEWIKRMNSDAIVFACANPTPEIWPWEAADAGAKVVATGRSDFPNQVNNSLAFPGIFRGVLDVRARTITDSMALAAARQIAGLAADRLRPDFILPRMDEWDLHPQVAAATGAAAQAAGVARLERSFDELVAEAEHMIRRARELQAAVNRQCEDEFGAKPDASRSS